MKIRTFWFNDNKMITGNNYKNERCYIKLCSPTDLQMLSLLYNVHHKLEISLQFEG